MVAVQASGSRWLQTEVLREELGFTGFVVVRCTTMCTIIKQSGLLLAGGASWKQYAVVSDDVAAATPGVGAVLAAIQSDYEADLELIDHGYAANESDAAYKALWAGVDMSMQSGLYRDYLPGLAKEGTLSMETLDEAVRRVLDSKARMGATRNQLEPFDSTAQLSKHAQIST